MLPANTYNPYEKGLYSAEIIVALEWLYQGLKAQINKMALFVLVLLLGLPFALFLGIWLRGKRRKFQKHMKRAVPTFEDANRYTEFKTNLERLTALVPNLKKVSAYNVKKAPLFLRYTLRQMQKMSSTLITFQSWQQSRLDCLNQEQFKSEQKIFKLVPEEELWKKRNKAYQYWM